jgi:hypothetical protein
LELFAGFEKRHGFFIYIFCDTRLGIVGKTTRAPAERKAPQASQFHPLTALQRTGDFVEKEGDSILNDLAP